MDAEIIAVGSELLTPARLDTNSLWLTERLNRRGVDVVRKTVIGDDRARLTRQIKTSRGSADIVILTGGLGPTLDDLTRECAAEATGRELVFHPEVIGWIKERFARFGREMSPNNERQAYRLDGAELLPNPNGTAPGQYLQDEHGVLMLLPGPPRELEPLFLAECEPRLDKLPSPWTYYTASLRIAGLGESDVDQRIGPIYSAEKRATTTILASPGEIQLHVRGRAKTLEEAREIAEAVARDVAEELGDHVYCSEDKQLESVIGDLLVERELELAVAESCTGGLIAQRITSVPGSSRYFQGGFVSYHERAKVSWLGVSQGLIDAHTAVSEPVAREMAERARDHAGGPREAIGLAVTGYAGPEGGPNGTPAGQVYIAIADGAETTCLGRKFGGDRQRVRALAAQTALDLLRRRLQKLQ